jgi:uncharacterized membrane protein
MSYYVAPIPARGIIKQNAKVAVSLQNKTTIRLWLSVFGIELGVGLVIGLIFSILWPVGFFFACIFFLQILQCGQLFAGVKLYRREHLEVRDVYCGFRDYSRILGGTLWWTLWTALWGCVPVMNVIKVYSYCMTPFILLDHPELTARQALKRSIQMTEGRKLDIFVLDLSFIGWHLLNLLTFGILGVFYVMPYYMTSLAGYYAEINDADRGKEDAVTITSADRDVLEIWTCPHCGARNTKTFCKECGKPRTVDGASGRGAREAWTEPPKTTPPVRSSDPNFKRPRGF